MRRRFQLWGQRQKSKRGSLYDSMELDGRTPSKRDMKKENSTTSIIANNTTEEAVDTEQIKELSTEQTILKILKVQKELTKVKKRIQDRRVVQQIEIHNMQSRKSKMQSDLKLMLAGSPLNHSEYLGVLRAVFQDDPFPSDKKFADEAVKTLKQEHKCHLLQGMATMVSNQNNEDLMLVMGSIPGLKDEMSKRSERIRSVLDQVKKQNLELKNVLHYKEYVMNKMKNKMEIQFTRRTSLSAAMVGLKSLELRTLQELADADSVAESMDDSVGQSSHTPSKWNEYRNKPESAGLASISDDEPFDENEDNEESEVDSRTSDDDLSGDDSMDGSLDQNSDGDAAQVGGNDEKLKKTSQRQRAQIARKQLEEKRNRRYNSNSTHSSFGGSETSESVSGHSATDNGDGGDDRQRRAEAARKRMEAKRRQQRLQKSTSSTNEATATSDDVDRQQQSLQNDTHEKPLESNGEGSAEKPMMSAAQKARLARQRRAEKLRGKNEREANKGIEGHANGTPQTTSLDTSTRDEGFDSSYRSITRTVPVPPPENLLQSPLWSVAKRAKDRTRTKSNRNLNDPKASPPAISSLPTLPDSSPGRRKASPGRRKASPGRRKASPGKRKAPAYRRVAERQKRIEDRLERNSQHKHGSASEDELESDSKPLSFSQLAKSHAKDDFPKTSMPSMNSDTQARIRNSMNKVNANPPTKSNDDGFTKLAKSHADGNFPTNTAPSMNADTQARILNSIPRSGSLPSEKPLVSPAEHRVLQAIADAQRRSSMTNAPTVNRVSSAEQRALQAIADAQRKSSISNASMEKRVSTAEQKALKAIADAQRKSSISNPPIEKRVSTAEQRALQAIADAQKGGWSQNPPIEKRVSNAEQRALQAIADAQKGGGSPDPPIEKRVSTAEQRALQAIADAQKGGGSPNPPIEKRVSTAEQRALQAIADAQKGGGSPDPPIEKRVSTAEQRALQAIADAQKGGGSPNPPIEKRVSSAEQRALQAISDAQKGGGSPPSEKRVSSAEQKALQAIAAGQKDGGNSNADTQERIRNSANVINGKGLVMPEKQAGSPSMLSAMPPKKQLGNTKSNPVAASLVPSRKDMMTRKQSTRKLESTKKIDSDRLKEQRLKAQLARQRLEEQRKLRQANRSKRNSNIADTSESPAKPAAKSSSKDETGTDSNAASSASLRRNRTGSAGSNRQTAIERSRARRARLDRAKSNET